jgi:excisionase family DNA binding protein
MTINVQTNRDAAERTTVSTKEAARMLGNSQRTLEDWRVTGGGPRFVKLGRKVRYRMSDLLDHLDRNTFGSTAEAMAA